MKQKGFTLIELMLVLAIVGILASIAVPAYQVYIGRTQVMEGFKATDGLRSEIAVWSANYKAFPDNSAVTQTGYVGAIAHQIDGKYIQQYGVVVTANTGVITVNFDAGNISGKNLVLTPTLNTNNNEQIIKWQCSGSIQVQYLPTSCQ